MGYTLETVISQIDNISCVEADDTNIFVGTTDGFLLHYVIHKDDPDSDNLDFTYLLASKQEAAGAKAPKAIVLLPVVQLAAVLANETVSFYSLPEFAPASDLRVVKDVQGVIQNSELQSRVEADGSASLTVFTRKKVRQLKVSRSAIKLAKEVEYFGCLAACQIGSILCLATKTAYDLVDLNQKAKIPLFPVVQGESNPVGPQYKTYRPRIASISSDEFLLVSGSPESPTTMGIFITLEGEITRGTLMFSAYPRQLCVQFPQVVALLSNNTIEVHDITTQESSQVIEVNEGSTLTSSTYEATVVLKKHLETMMLRRNAPSDQEKMNLADLNQARRISDVRSSLLVKDREGVRALVTDSLLLKIDKLLDDGHLQQALTMAETLSREASPVYAERLYHELAYTHQKAGLLYFTKMLFDDAVDNFNKGNIDPRVLISLFPEYEAKQEDVTIYAGIYQTITGVENVDETIRLNLSQTVDDDATLLELTTILKANATELLRRYLTQYRGKRDFASTSNGQHSKRIFSIVDSTLLKILLKMDVSEAAAKMKDFFNNDMEDVDAIADILKAHSQWHYLALLYSRNQRHLQALEIWQGIETKNLVDEDHPSNGAQLIKDYLLQHGNNELVWDFGLWLIRHSLDLGIELFSQAVASALVTFPIQAVLGELKKDKADYIAYTTLLEFLVITEGLQDNELRNDLLLILGNRLIEALKEDSVKVSIIKFISEYRALPVPKVPYLAFVSDVQNPSEQEAVIAFNMKRKKFIDLLQESAEYDAQRILNIILQEKSVLLAERILLYGRLSNHADSLNLLVHDLKDFDSAEVYCYHGGISLSQIRISSDKIETVAMRRELFPLLFSEYLKLEDYSMQFTQGSKILNRWGNYMDISLVLGLIPDHWSVELVSNFLIGALAQLSGEKREAQVRRSLARAQVNRGVTKQYIRLE